jgi:hypothetical protein
MVIARIARRCIFWIIIPAITVPAWSAAPSVSWLALECARVQQGRAALYLLKRVDGVVLRREENRTRPRGP